MAARKGRVKDTAAAKATHTRRSRTSLRSCALGRSRRVAAQTDEADDEGVQTGGKSEGGWKSGVPSEINHQFLYMAYLPIYIDPVKTFLSTFYCSERQKGTIDAGERKPQKLQIYFLHGVDGWAISPRALERERESS